MESIVPAENSAVEKPHVLRILVVDDNEFCAKVMMWTMELLGHTAQMAFDGPSAIECATSFCPDVIILDIGLPGMNGYEISQAMHKEPLLQHSIFVALTGWGQKEHRERTKEAGFDYHLVKPVDMEVLKTIMRTAEKNARWRAASATPLLEIAQ